MRFSELRCRDVVNVKDGCRVGCVSDLVLDTKDSDILALVVPGKAKFFGIFGREEDYVLPWKSIVRIGPDVILVDLDVSKTKEPCIRKRFFKK